MWGASSGHMLSPTLVGETLWTLHYQSNPFCYMRPVWLGAHLPVSIAVAGLHRHLIWSAEGLTPSRIPPGILGLPCQQGKLLHRPPLLQEIFLTVTI